MRVLRLFWSDSMAAAPPANVKSDLDDKYRPGAIFLFPVQLVDKQESIFALSTLRLLGKLQRSIRLQISDMRLFFGFLFLGTVTRGCAADCGFGFEDMEVGGAARIKKIIFLSDSKSITEFTSCQTSL